MRNCETICLYGSPFLSLRELSLGLPVGHFARHIRFEQMPICNLQLSRGHWMLLTQGINQPSRAANQLTCSLPFPNRDKKKSKHLNGIYQVQLCSRKPNRILKHKVPFLLQFAPLGTR